MQTTEGRLLGGRVRYAQPAKGFRSGIEPVLLAASIPARPGERVLEAGTGAGAALLCLGARVPGVTGVGVEIDRALAALAAENFRANEQTGFEVRAEPLAELPPDCGMFDHAFCNPPYHPERGTPSLDSRKQQAKRGGVGLIEEWVLALGQRLRPRGTLTVILPAARLTEAVASMLVAHCGAIAILPLWPAAGRAAKLVLVQATRDRSGPDRVLPGLVLHEPDGRFTDAAEAILRGGAALDFQ